MKQGVAKSLTHSDWKEITTLSDGPSEIWVQLMELASVQLYKVSEFRMKGTSPSRASRAPEGLRFTATQCHDGEVKLFINLF